jgi:hypothetical protein
VIPQLHRRAKQELQQLPKATLVIFANILQDNDNSVTQSTALKAKRMRRNGECPLEIQMEMKAKDNL